MLVLPQGGFLKISADVLEHMGSYRQLNETDLEAGGMLIGHHPVGTNDIILDRMTEPQPGDRRTRNRFYRSQDAHQHLLDEEWERSNYTRTYVGEWHTHPEAKPRPSIIDRLSWLRSAFETNYQGPGLVFVILGTENTSVWSTSRKYPIGKYIGHTDIIRRK